MRDSLRDSVRDSVLDSPVLLIGSVLDSVLDASLERLELEIVGSAELDPNEFVLEVVGELIFSEELKIDSVKKVDSVTEFVGWVLGRVRVPVLLLLLVTLVNSIFDSKELDSVTDLADSEELDSLTDLVDSEELNVGSDTDSVEMNSVAELNSKLELVVGVG